MIEIDNLVERKEIVDILKRAKSILEKEGAWARGKLAKDCKGREIDEYDPAAVSFCMIGSIYRAGFELYQERAEDIGYNGESRSLYAESMLAEFTPGDISTFNDSPLTTLENVLSVFDESIKAHDNDNGLEGQ